MKNISFDNPLLLLIAIPMLLLVLVPHFIAIRKTNRTVGTIISLIAHILIVCLVTLTAAGMKQTNVITETEVFVVVDVSNSTDKSLDEVDKYIKDIDDSLPENSKFGVICFGKDYKITTEMGGKFKTVKNSGVDNSATDIVSALEYASTRFSEDAIKRVVLITDGKQTASDGRLTNDDGTRALIQSVKELRNRDIYVDAVYLDSNLDEDDIEVQLEGVDYAIATYLNHEATAEVLVRASKEMIATITLTQQGREEPIGVLSEELVVGLNVVQMNLPTDVAGDFVYTVTVESADDYSEFNNEYSFTQEVSGDVKVLVLASAEDDVKAAMEIFGDQALLDIYLINDIEYNEKYQSPEILFGSTPNFDRATVHINTSLVPCTMAELCRYDEYMLVNIDIRELNNCEEFLRGIYTAVSEFGKSLVTIGDTSIQNKTDESLSALEQMLPVKFGNNENEPKLYTVVVDVSLSMVGAYRFEIAKEIAAQLIELMNPDDQVAVVLFSGDITIAQLPTAANDPDELRELIENADSSQGTAIGSALKVAHDLVNELDYSEKYIYLISDFLEGGLAKDSYTTWARKCFADGMIVSTIGVICGDEGKETMRTIAQRGGGEFYDIRSQEEISDILLSEIANDMTQSVIDGEQTEVDVERDHDRVLNEVPYLPDIYGYVFAKSKASATDVLSVEFDKGFDLDGYELGTTTAALYSYWSFDKGRVATYTGAISGEWVKDWKDDPYAQKFFDNLLYTSIPETKIDDPYTVGIDYDGISSTLEIIPGGDITTEATITAEVIYPDGNVVPLDLLFNTSRYFCSFETPMLGQYRIVISYVYDGKEYASYRTFCLPYSSEYDAFEYFSSAGLKSAVAAEELGIVSEKGIPKLENDKSRVETYVYDFTMLLMIIAISLFMVDLTVRILKWKDVKALFGFGKKSKYNAKGRNK